VSAQAEAQCGVADPGFRFAHPGYGGSAISSVQRRNPALTPLPARIH
jgi:hypothetical protein